MTERKWSNHHEDDKPFNFSLPLTLSETEQISKETRVWVGIYEDKDEFTVQVGLFSEGQGVSVSVKGTKLTS